MGPGKHIGLVTQRHTGLFRGATAGEHQVRTTELSSHATLRPAWTWSKLCASLDYTQLWTICSVSV